MEAAALLRLIIWTVSFVKSQKNLFHVFPLPRMSQLLRWFKVEGQMDQQTSVELDRWRCSVTSRIWSLFSVFALGRLVMSQVLTLRGQPRLFPEFDWTFFFIAGAGLLVNCKPCAITPRSLDVWYVVTATIFNLSLIPARHVDVRDMMALTLAGRFLFAVLVRRSWLFVLFTLVSLIQTLNMAWLQRENTTNGESFEDHSLVPVILGVYLTIFLGFALPGACWRRTQS